MAKCSVYNALVPTETLKLNGPRRLHKMQQQQRRAHSCCHTVSGLITNHGYTRKCQHRQWRGVLHIQVHDETGRQLFLPWQMSLSTCKCHLVLTPDLCLGAEAGQQQRPYSLDDCARKCSKKWHRWQTRPTTVRSDNADRHDRLQ